LYNPLYILFLLLIISVGSSKAQNLVYNGDFEIYDTCPYQYSIITNIELEHALGWKIPTTGTSDYFNSCNSNSNLYANVDVPNNFVGYQNAFNGDGYAGLYAYTNYINGAEYIQSRLTSPLKAGYTYTVSFYISQADSSEYSITEIGAYFSENAINRNDFAPFNFSPQIHSPTGLFLNDMLGWTKIEGTFIANGGEQYITIGNFKDSVETDTINTGIISSTGQDAAYYYIDGVETIEIGKVILIPNIITPNGDGMNDVFQLNFPYSNVVIYNRWGQNLFENNNNESYWNGRTTSGSEVPDGTYYYIITTEKETYKGYLQLLR